MAIGNMQPVLTLLEGFLASEFADTTYNRNQGSALLVDFVRQIASRADLTYSNLRITAPAVNTANDVDVESGAVGLIAVIAATNATATEDAAILTYETNTVTEGTTRYITMLNVDAAASTATGKMFYQVFPEPIPMAALSWSAVDNGADGDIEGITLTAAGGIRVMLVYAE
jgi:hypothetical protein